MIKRALTLVNAMKITPRILINDAAGPEAADPLVVCTIAPVRTPVPEIGTGCRRAPEAERDYQLRVMDCDA
jgi:hypothetical protein